jgi:hypothetical protein
VAFIIAANNIQISKFQSHRRIPETHNLRRLGDRALQIIPGEEPGVTGKDALVEVMTVTILDLLYLPATNMAEHCEDVMITDLADHPRQLEPISVVETNMAPLVEVEILMMDVRDVAVDRHLHTANGTADIGRDLWTGDGARRVRM